MKPIRNVLVQYKGGGYDGCYWEWNFFMFDGRGKFHNLASSGRHGIETAEQAKELMRSKNFKEESYVYNLKNKKAVKEFSDETNPRLVDIIGTKLNNILKKPIVSFECDECGSEIALNHEGNNYPRMFHDPHNYTGNGGVGIIQYGKLCEDCYLSHSCGYCGEFNELEENDVDDVGHCIHCAPSKIEVMYASKKSDAMRIAIHLLDPTPSEVDDAKKRAERDLFELIVIHSKKTWPSKQKGGAQ